MPQLLPDQEITQQWRQGQERFWAGAIIGLAVAYHLRFKRYERNVGVESSSARGFRIWEAQQRSLLRHQPRRSQLTYIWVGSVTLALFFLISFLGAWSPGWVLVMLALVIVTWVAAQRRRPPTALVEAINAWHRDGSAR